MWPFRIPPFAGHPGIPDPGLTTGDWLILLLTAAISVAACAQAFIAYRIWRPKVEIFMELHTPHLVGKTVSIGKEKQSGGVGKAFLNVTNLSPVAIWLGRMTIIHKEIARKKLRYADLPYRWWVNKVILPGQTHVEEIASRIYNAIQEEGKPTIFYAQRVEVKIYYRVHEAWHQQSVLWFDVYVLSGGEMFFPRLAKVMSPSKPQA